MIYKIIRISVIENCHFDILKMYKYFSCFVLFCFVLKNIYLLFVLIN